MVAWMRGRTNRAVWYALAGLGALGGAEAMADLFSRPKPAQPKAAAPATKDQAPPRPFRQEDVPRLERTRVMVNPTDPIATINGEAITRQQLADECVARKGEEILETLIARKLIDMELRRLKLDVSQAEIDAEIDKVANNVAHISREAWLATLDKERGISPVQYARDIIYPALALRKLAAPSVQVSEKDMKESFEAQYGDKLRCRIIMVDKLPKAQDIWERLRKNPAGFEKIAQEESMDSGSRSLGGLLAEPITRHAFPRTVSEAAFQQLVDGDPKDTDLSHRPKDGDFTGPIQVAEATWVILKREERIPPAKGVSASDPRVRENVHAMIYEVKLKEAMGEYFVGLMKRAAIVNHLTGTEKLANEEQHPDHRVDGEVKLMSNPAAAQPPRPGAPTVPAAGPKLPTPVSAPAEALRRAPVRK